MAVIAFALTLMGPLGCSNDGGSDPARGATTRSPRNDGSAGANGGAGATPETMTSADGPVTFGPFHIVGRYDARDPAGPRLGWPGVEIRARFSGTGIKVQLADRGTSHYDVRIDGGPARLLVVAGSKKIYELATGLGPGEHELVLTKRTETATGVTQLFGFVGTLLPAPEPTGRRIELLGDSITCGYGVLGPDANCGFSPDTESEQLAWGALAANELGALRMVTAVSGIGVLRNYDGSTSDTMPARYDRAIADDPKSTWDHQAFHPDVVVVNLGTNDFGGGKGDPGSGFEATYTQLLADVRARHPDARIVATTSPLLDGDSRPAQRAYIEAAIAARASAGDSKITLVDLDEQSPSDGYGCDSHPSATTQRKMAAKLVQHLKSVMGW